VPGARGRAPGGTAGGGGGCGLAGAGSMQRQLQRMLQRRARGAARATWPVPLAARIPSAGVGGPITGGPGGAGRREGAGGRGWGCADEKNT
jgi:hypothetical protein